jgi:hypothetical protein
MRARRLPAPTRSSAQHWTVRLIALGRRARHVGHVEAVGWGRMREEKAAVRGGGGADSSGVALRRGVRHRRDFAADFVACGAAVYVAVQRRGPPGETGSARRCNAQQSARRSCDSCPRTKYDAQRALCSTQMAAEDYLPTGGRRPTTHAARGEMDLGRHATDCVARGVRDATCHRTDATGQRASMQPPTNRWAMDFAHRRSGSTRRTSHRPTAG